MDNTISIELKSISKKFNREWIFKEVNMQLTPGSKTVILGGNGSGKSTLLQIIAGYLIPEKGELIYASNNQAIKIEDVNDHISFASPYIELTESFTLPELIDHVRHFKPFTSNLVTTELVALMELSHALKKPIKHFSSGMKQRVKLGMAILSDTSVLFLDEPLSNLDSNGVSWYKKMIDTYAKEKTIVVCSNAIKDEFGFCEKELNIADYKRN